MSCQLILSEDSEPERARWRRPLQVLLLVGVLGAVGAWAAWRTPFLHSKPAIPADSAVVTVGVRVGESQAPAFLNMKSGGASMIGFKSGETLWIVPTLDGDRLRLTLYDAPESARDRKPVAKASLTKSQPNDIRPVMFQFDYATVHLWWAPALPKPALD